MVGYWDTVADRLFKIRNCLNIEGIARQLPLFQPPIDPGLLVKAAAAGLDIGSVMRELSAPLPNYRFHVVMQKANEVVSSLRGLGAQILSALEKRDAEELALLRVRHETNLAEAERAVKEQAVLEARENRAALTDALKGAELRQQRYAARESRSSKERLQLKKLENAFALQTTSQAVELLAGVLALIPQFKVGVSGAFGTPVVTAEVGGAQANTAIQVASRALQLAASVETYQANKASLEAAYDRRTEDWLLQSDVAKNEAHQIRKQMTAAEIRIAVAERDLESHELRIEQSRQIEAYFRARYTNTDLYGWMIGQLAGLYFRSYSLAYELATRAERCFRHELGVPSSSYIQPGHWESLKQGLLAGERLELDLHALSAAYLDQHRREYEHTKNVSARQVDPLALLTLKATGSCELSLPEAIFDLDAPGHYLRRLKSVSVSIPCVVGPYATVSCTVSLLSSSVRMTPQLLDGVYQRQQDDPRFVDYFGAIQSMVTSTANNDSGLFDASGADGRCLPFEGAGAESRWRIELPPEFRQFDYETISDVILHLRHTARQGGAQLRDAATDRLREIFSEVNDQGPTLLLSLTRDYPGEWHRFVSGGQPLSIPLGRRHFPYLANGRAITVSSMALVGSGPGTPVALAVTEADVGLLALPAFAPDTPADLQLVFRDNPPLVPRNARGQHFVVLRYTMS